VALFWGVYRKWKVAQIDMRSAHGDCCFFNSIGERSDIFMQKVMLLTPFFAPNVGGAESFALDLQLQLQRHGYKVKVCTIDWGKQKTWKGTNIFKTLYTIPRLWFNAVEHTDVDFIHALGLNAAFVAKILGKEYRVMLLALYDFNKKPFWFRKLCAWVLNGAETVYVEGNTGVLDAINAGVLLSKIVKFQHWCDQYIFKPRYIEHDNMIVLFIGRPIPEKGKHVIQESELLLKGRRIQFVYVENASHLALPEYYKSADVVVVPSLYPEGFSRVVIEAASCGCAVITSNRGSLPELVSAWGICINPTPDYFADTLLEFYDDKEYLQKCKHRALEYARANFSERNAEVFL
jgi:glycosyltransferase involved in cell wall biosynthesis